MANDAERDCGENGVREGGGKLDRDLSLVRTTSVDREGHGKGDREPELEIVSLSGSLSVDGGGDDKSDREGDRGRSTSR